ncbi:MAG: recombinase family protein [Pseudomonadota bacterium]
MTRARKLRCAIYTRKSTEDGLDQDFNSLDAQREACASFICSQAGLGWRAVSDRFDDGGLSGATMERPALRRLLSEIKANRIDVVVVYKIDRLTRSLMDFARIVDLFDAQRVSFVSVTQQFNTTTSMGRLTLNVLLSFAQFEREVTAERIRDKIAASRKKGLWMGGSVPLGYRVENKALIPDPTTSETVRYIYKRYLALKSVQLLGEDLDRSDLAGLDPTKPISRGRLYTLLKNPIYIGKVRHRDQIYDGVHDAILDNSVFNEVQKQLERGAPKRVDGHNRRGPHLLTGLVFDETGDRLVPTHTNKRGKRYYYYVSDRLRRLRGATPAHPDIQSGWRIAARELERTVEGELTAVLSDPLRLSKVIASVVPVDQMADTVRRCAARLKNFQGATQEGKRSTLQRLLETVRITPQTLTLQINSQGVMEWLLGDGDIARIGATRDETYHTVTIEREVAIKRRGVETKLILSPNRPGVRPPDPVLVGLLETAHRAFALLTDGSERSIAGLARDLNVDRGDINRLLPLVFVSPKIVEAILEGTQPADMTGRRLSRLSDLPLGWDEQNALLLGRT